MRINEPISNQEVTYEDDDLLISKTNTKGIITYCNEVFMRIAGFEESELLGKNHNMVRHPDMPSEAFQDLWDTVRDGKEWHGIVKNRCKNGDHYWVDATVTPDYDSKGQIVGYMSARRKASSQQIADAEKLYKELNAKRGSRRR
ncbi:PAS domain-containing protein [Mariprofundus sp. KV]|uniref:PAS domain-containing protein n=1 Tax=Mariprofundus sp. KV TaxID=2608715 RepID=UPI0017943A9A|nr:PAS domain-containing protein [Mariprofundus sp. KV]NWF37106.1 PAS domain-containing protein [Mariprofundus sp. KV]